MACIGCARCVRRRDVIFTVKTRVGIVTSTHFFSLLFFSVLISTEEYNLTNEVKGAFEGMVTRLNQDNGIVKYNNDDENDENDEY